MSDMDVPIDGFQLWSRGQRRNIQQENPEMHFGEISKRMAKEWEQMNDYERQPFDDHVKRLEHYAQMEKEHQQVELSSDEDDSEDEQEEMENMHPPANAFLLWCRWQRRKIRQENPEMPTSEVTGRLLSVSKAEWDQKSDSDKRPYEDEVGRLTRIAQKENEVEQRNRETEATEKLDMKTQMKEDSNKTLTQHQMMMLRLLRLPCQQLHFLPRNVHNEVVDEEVRVGAAAKDDLPDENGVSDDSSADWERCSDSDYEEAEAKEKKKKNDSFTLIDCEDAEKLDSSKVAAEKDEQADMTAEEVEPTQWSVRSLGYEVASQQRGVPTFRASELDSHLKQSIATMERFAKGYQQGQETMLEAGEIALFRGAFETNVKMFFDGNRKEMATQEQERYIAPAQSEREGIDSKGFNLNLENDESEPDIDNMDFSNWMDDEEEEYEYNFRKDVEAARRFVDAERTENNNSVKPVPYGVQLEDLMNTVDTDEFKQMVANFNNKDRNDEGKPEEAAPVDMTVYELYQSMMAAYSHFLDSASSKMTRWNEMLFENVLVGEYLHDVVLKNKEQIDNTRDHIRFWIEKHFETSGELKIGEETKKPSVKKLNVYNLYLSMKADYPEFVPGGWLFANCKLEDHMFKEVFTGKFYYQKILEGEEEIEEARQYIHEHIKSYILLNKSVKEETAGRKISDLEESSEESDDDDSSEDSDEDSEEDESDSEEKNQSEEAEPEPVELTVYDLYRSMKVDYPHFLDHSESLAEWNEKLFTKVLVGDYVHDVILKNQRQIDKAMEYIDICIHEHFLSFTESEAVEKKKTPAAPKMNMFTLYCTMKHNYPELATDGRQFSFKLHEYMLTEVFVGKFAFHRVPKGADEIEEATKHIHEHIKSYLESHKDSDASDDDDSSEDSEEDSEEETDAEEETTPSPKMNLFGLYLSMKPNYPELAEGANLRFSGKFLTGNFKRVLNGEDEIEEARRYIHEHIERYISSNKDSEKATTKETNLLNFEDSDESDDDDSSENSDKESKEDSDVNPTDWSSPQTARSLYLSMKENYPEIAEDEKHSHESTEFQKYLNNLVLGEDLDKMLENKMEIDEMRHKIDVGVRTYWYINAYHEKKAREMQQEQQEESKHLKRGHLANSTMGTVESKTSLLEQHTSQMQMFVGKWKDPNQSESKFEIALVPNESSIRLISLDGSKKEQTWEFVEFKNITIPEMTLSCMEGFVRMKMSLNQGHLEIRGYNSQKAAVFTETYERA